MYIIFFFILLVFFSAITIFERKQFLKKTPTKAALYILLFTLCIICSFRDDSVRDTVVYIDAFNDGDERLEIGFMTLVAVLKKISSATTFLFFVIAVLTVGLKLFFFKSYSYYFFSTVLIFFSSSFLVDDFVAIRSAFVTGIMLWMAKFAVDRRIISFILLLALATSFHVSAMIGLFIWPIINMRIKLDKFLWILPIAYLLYFTGKSLGFLASYITIPYVQALFALYSGETGDEIGFVNVFAPSHVIRCLLCVYIIWVNKRRNLNKIYESMLKLYCFGISLFVILTDVPAFSSRLCGLYLIFGALVVGNLFYYMPNKNVLFVRLVIVVYALLNFISNYLNVLS